jgi:predicted aspartyl protease
MRERRVRDRHHRLSLGLAIVAAACGGAETAPRPIPAPVPTVASASASAVAPPPPDLCAAAVDARDLLARSAKAFGSEQAVAETLPRVIRREIATEGKKGMEETVLDHVRLRVEMSLAGIYEAEGIDAAGPWEVGPPGVLLRLRPDEAIDVAGRQWFELRGYLSQFDPRRDSARCVVVDGHPRAILSYELPSVGRPELTFDLASAALLSFSAAHPDGRRPTTRIDAWSGPDLFGVRWPEATTEIDPVANPTTSLLLGLSAGGLACTGVDPRAASTKDCLAPPAPLLEFSWPPSGVVRVPMRHYLNELSLRVKLGGREVWALLDSGAGLTALDATTPAGASFVPSMEVSGSGSSQKVRMGLGTVDTLAIGDLTLRHVPVVSVPIPALDAYGDRRPEVIAGYSIFLGAIVRVDYAAGEVVLGKTLAAQKKPGAIALPFRVANGKWVTDVDLAGTKAPFEIDTGNASGLSLEKRWADAHGLPGDRPRVEVQARTGAGTAPTPTQLFRVDKASLGPITYDGHITHVDDPPGGDTLAGLVGNDMLSRCAAVTFDVESRTMWLEPPCDRPRPEDLASWRLGKKESDQAKGRPWVIEVLLPGGSADLAGLKVGDRILDVGGVPAALDVSKIDAVTRRPAGTKLAVTYQRDGVTGHVTMELRSLLASPD